MTQSCLSSQSPAAKSDFARFMQTNPDLTDVVVWINDNIDLDEIINGSSPDDLFDFEDLEKWAKKNNYYEYISDFPQEKIDVWVKDNQEKFGNPNIKNILKNDCNLNLTYSDDVWMIWDIWHKEVKFSADTMEELEKTIGEHFEKIEQEEKRKREESDKRWKEAMEAKRVAAETKKTKTTTTGKRTGRPKGSKNKTK
jgi:hypothetical protein